MRGADTWRGLGYQVISRWALMRKAKGEKSKKMFGRGWDGVTAVCREGCVCQIVASFLFFFFPVSHKNAAHKVVTALASSFLRAFSITSLGFSFLHINGQKEREEAHGHCSYTETLEVHRRLPKQ